MSSLSPFPEMPAHAQRLLAVSPSLLGACGFDGYVKLLNPAWTRLLGLTEAEALAVPYLDLVHPDDRAEAGAALAALAAGGRPREFVCRVRRADGEYRSLRWSGQASADDACVYLAGIDITDRLRLEHEAQELAYVASHDLSEPLRMITSYLDLLQRRYGTQLDDRAEEFIRFAVDGADRLRALLDDLLVYSRAGSHQLTIAEVDIEELLAVVLRALAPAIGEAGATVTGPGAAPALRGDRGQLGQLLQGLLANAVRFRAADRPPAIAVTVVAEDGGVRLDVADNGIGIASGHHERIFEMFARLHGRDAYPGTGIGLPVCRRIAERHGGRVWVSSEPGAGSVFSVWIPGG